MTTQIKFTTAEEAVKVIKSGDHIHLSSVASAPQCLINAMCARGEAGELKDVHIHHLHTEMCIRDSRILFQSGLNYMSGCEEVEKQVPQSKERDELVKFIRESKRGIIKPYESVSKEE